MSDQRELDRSRQMLPKNTLLVDVRAIKGFHSENSTSEQCGERARITSCQAKASWIKSLLISDELRRYQGMSRHMPSVCTLIRQKQRTRGGLAITLVVSVPPVAQVLVSWDAPAEPLEIRGSTK
jgi:hypothetical protein